MVEFWGLFVVFSACAAFQITESRTHNAYRPTELSSNENLLDIGDGSSNELNDSPRLDTYVPLHVKDLSNSIEDSSSESAQSAHTDPPKHVQEDSSEESDENDESDESKILSTKSNKHLNLEQRRNRLYYFSVNAISKYEKDFVRQTREHIKSLLIELEALPEKSAEIKETLHEINDALAEIDDIDVTDDEPADFSALENAMDTIVYLNLEPENASPELEQVLEKVGWLIMRNDLVDKLHSLIDEFGKQFDIFIKSLSPWERIISAAFVDLHKRFTKSDADGKWNLLNEFWAQFSE